MTIIYKSNSITITKNKMTLFYLMIMMIIQIIGKILCLNWNLINKVKIKIQSRFF